MPIVLITKGFAVNAQPNESPQASQARGRLWNSAPTRVLHAALAIFFTSQSSALNTGNPEIGSRFSGSVR